MNYETLTVESQPQTAQVQNTAQYINAAKSPEKAHRFLVTLQHLKTGEERLLDVLIDDCSFKALATEVRKHYDYSFEFLEWFDPSEPF